MTVEDEIQDAKRQIVEILDRREPDDDLRRLTQQLDRVIYLRISQSWQDFLWASEREKELVATRRLGREL